MMTITIRVITIKKKQILKIVRRHCLCACVCNSRILRGFLSGAAWEQDNKGFVQLDHLIKQDKKEREREKE